MFIFTRQSLQSQSFITTTLTASTVWCEQRDKQVWNKMKVIQEVSLDGTNHSKPGRSGTKLKNKWWTPDQKREEASYLSRHPWCWFVLCGRSAAEMNRACWLAQSVLAGFWTKTFIALHIQHVWHSAAHFYTDVFKALFFSLRWVSSSSSSAMMWN